MPGGRMHGGRTEGAVAGGSREAVAAGLWALGEGGTAVDAAIAAVLAAFVVEGPLTGPAGGGFVLCDQRDDDPWLLDCFFAAPARQGEPMDAVEIDFGDASTQVFHIGEGSVAVPGLVAGLEEAHARRGRLPWDRLFVPALELARSPRAASPQQAFIHEILAAILQRDAGGRRVYGTPGQIDASDLVETLRALQGGGRHALAELLPDWGDEIDAYVVEERAPLQTRLGGLEILATPAPSVGGEVVALATAHLERAGARVDGTGVASGLALAQALAAGYAGQPSAGQKPTGTTHVSVLDTDGAVAALSSTLGSGSGVFRHGFQLNNMLGELDVVGVGSHLPGARLPSMMTPTLALDEGRPRVALGSAGSVRLAGAIAQVLARVVTAGTPLDEAIAAPRLHLDGRTVHVEGGWHADLPQVLREEGFDVVEWSARNLFFGGTNGVEAHPVAGSRAAGDPRRGGHGATHA